MSKLVGELSEIHILFALAIGGEWQKSVRCGPRRTFIYFLNLTRITGVFFGSESVTFLTKQGSTKTVFGWNHYVADYFVRVLEAPALNMGVFVGIIAGFVGATACQQILYLL